MSLLTSVAHKTETTIDQENTKKNPAVKKRSIRLHDCGINLRLAVSISLSSRETTEKSLCLRLQVVPTAAMSHAVGCLALIRNFNALAACDRIDRAPYTGTFGVEVGTGRFATRRIVQILR